MFCSLLSFMKYVFSPKIWSVKTSTIFVKYESWVVRSNPDCGFPDVSKRFQEWCYSNVFIVNFEHISHIALDVSNFEQINADWVSHFNVNTLTFPATITDEEKKLNFYFHTFLWDFKRFYGGDPYEFSWNITKCKNKNWTWFLF